MEPYQLDIGDTFVTSFIGTVNAGSNKLTVMSPVGSTGQDPSVTPIYKTGQIITCDEDGVLTEPTKIIGINTGTADLAQIPTTGPAGVVTTNVSTVNILSVSPVAGLAVSAFDSTSFSVLDNPTTGPVGVISDVTSNGEVYKENQKYHAVPSTSNFSGEGATFSVFTNSSGGIATTGISTTTGGVSLDIIGAGGLGYSNGDTITIAGTSLLLKTGVAGTSADDLTFTVKSIQDGRFRFAVRCKDTARFAFNKYETFKGLNSFYQEKFYKYKDEQIKSLKKYISNWNSEKNLILVTHFVVISEMLNFGTSSGEIVVIDKDYKFIGSIETMW